MCLVGHAFGGEILLINIIGPISYILVNRVLFFETSDLSSDHPNFPCFFCTKIFDGKNEMVKHLYTCDGTEDLSAMILLSVMRKLRTISTSAITLMILPCSFCPKIVKEKPEVIEPMEVQRFKHGNFQCVVSVKKPLWVLRILFNTSSITTSADADMFFFAVTYALLCSYLK